jgi:hypothetical protein
MATLSLRAIATNYLGKTALLSIKRDIFGIYSDDRPQIYSLKRQLNWMQTHTACHTSLPFGSLPSAEQKTRFRGAFPNLQLFNITAPATGGSWIPGSYNCIAWSVGVTNQWFWPGETVDAFDAFYTSHGWSVTANCAPEYKKRKVALYAMNRDPNDCTHGSRETVDCDWHESKCGSWERIVHDRRQMEDGNVYGDIIKCYEKADPNANLDLA